MADAFWSFTMIKIAVVSYNDEAPTNPIFAIFGPEQQTIGRSNDNFLALPDPKHFVSRTQAKVWSDGDRHHLINTSLANPILVNSKEIESESEYELHVGDQIQIGSYLLLVDPADGYEISTAMPAPKQAGNATPSSKTHPAKMSNPPPSVKTTTQPPSFLMRTEPPFEQTEKLTETKKMHQTPPQSESKHLPNAALPATAAADAATSSEPGKSEPKEQPALQTQQANDLLQAFLQGAGLPGLNLSSGLTIDLMETMGKLVATSVQGVMQLISQRALVKREVNADVTMVVLRKNNPLKFFPDNQTVLTQMLRKKMPGFMAPAEAMEDAFFDLRAHQLGLSAGNQAVMDALLKKMQPASFEKKLVPPTLLDYINPARRKAAMWDHFSALFDSVSQESKNEFQSLFGKEFLAAYETEVEKVRRGTHVASIF
jgi:FHA domain-containing protein